MPYSDKELLFNSLAQPLWDTFARETLALIQREYKPAPQVFISYAWPNRKYSSFDAEQDIQVWLLGLHERLTYLGVKLLYDIKSITRSTDIDGYIQHGVKNSDKILIIGTESYLKSSFEPTNVQKQLGYIREKVTAKGESCVISMLYRGEFSNALPLLSSDNSNIQIIGTDCHNEFFYQKNLPNLIENLFQLQNNPEYQILKQTYTVALKKIGDHELSDAQVNQFSQHQAAKARIVLQAQREVVNKVIEKIFKTHPDYPAQSLDMPSFSVQADYLKNKYQQHATVASLFGKPMPLEKQYINVQMLYETYEEKQNKDNSSPDESSKNSHITSQDTLTQKQPLEIAQFFLPTRQLLKNNQTTKKEDDLNNPPRFILLQGCAGAGKTTFVNFVSREWSMGRLWTEYDWVFTLRLRELRLKSFAQASSREETWSLSDWIYEIHFASLMEKPDFENFWHLEIASKLNNKVLFILDGYDETPKVHPCKKALADLLQSPTPKILTSRPYGLSDLPEKYRKLEVFGFVDANIEKYIKLYFADEHVTKAEQIITALKSNLTLWDSAHIPVNLNILCGILEKSNDLSTTLRELHNLSGQYEVMEMALLERAYCNVPGQEQRNTAQLAELARSDVTRKNQLLQKHYESLREYLAQIAFITFLKQQPYVSVELIHQELRNAGVVVTQISEAETVRALTSLGLLNPVLGKGKDAHEIIGYEFLHKTFEEYYAGRHILWQVKQTNLGKLVHDLSKVKLDPRYRPVLEFTAGALKDDKQFDCFMRALTHPLGSDMLGHYQLVLLIRCTEANWELAKRTSWVKLVTEQLQERIRWLYKTSKLRRPIWVDLLKLSVEGYNTQSGVNDLFYKIKLNIMSSKVEKTSFSNFVSWFRIPTIYALTQLTYQLADENWEISRDAVFAIKSLGASAGSSNMLDVLAHLLRGKEFLALLNAIVDSGVVPAATPAILKTLARFLMDKNEYVRSEGVQALGSLGISTAIPAILDTLTPLLADEKNKVQLFAEDAIDKLNATVTPATLKALIFLKNDPEWRMLASKAIWAIKNLHPYMTSGILEVLEHLLEDKEADVRLETIIIIGELGASAATPTILNVLVRLLLNKATDEAYYLLHNNPFYSIRYEIIKAIEKLTAASTTISPLILDALTTVLLDEDKVLQKRTIEAIGKLGASAAILPILDALIRLLTDKETDLRRHAIEAIGELGASAAIPPILDALVRLLTDKETDLRYVTIDAIGKLGVAAAVPPILESLTQLLVGEDSYYRYWYINTLGKLGAATSPAILKALINALYDGEWSRARANLELYMTPDVLKALNDLLSNEKHVRWNASWMIGANNLFNPLFFLLVGEDRDLRLSAFNAIRILGTSAVQNILERLTRMLGTKNKGRSSNAGADVIPAFLETLTCLLVDEVNLKELNASAATPAILEAISYLTRMSCVMKEDINLLEKLVKSYLAQQIDIITSENNFSTLGIIIAGSHLSGKISFSVVWQMEKNENLPEVLAGLRYKKVQGDGHGLFFAIGLCLDEDAPSLRNRIVAHLELNFTDFKDYRSLDGDFKNYIENIRIGAELGDNIEITIIQRIISRPIIVIRSDANPTIFGNLAERQGDPIFIYCNNGHYDAFVTEIRGNSQNILEKVRSHLATGAFITCPTQITQLDEYSQYNGYLWQGFVDKEPFSIKLTPDQARWIRHQTPKIIKSLDTGAEKLSEIINTGINILPQAINDPMLHEYNQQKNNQALSGEQLGLISNSNNNDLNLKVSVLNHIRFSDGDICLHDLTIDTNEYLQELMGALRNKQNIKSITINNVKASDEALGEILEFIVKLREIVKVIITRQNLSMRNWQRICNVVENNPLLKYLGLAENNITVGQFNTLAGYISRHTSLSELDLSRNRVSCLSVTLDNIKNLLEKCMTLKKVTINQNFLEKDSKPKFASSSVSEQGLLCYAFFQTKAYVMPSILSPKLMIDSNHWIVALACKKGSEHSRIYLEGMRKNGQRFLECYHIFGSLLGNKASVEVKKFYEFDTFNPENFHLRPWEIKRENGHTLKLLVQAEQGADINFSFLSSTSFFEKQYNCLKWCLKLLTKIGIEHSITDILPSSAATPSKNENKLKV
jgi:HEAT repeat protein